MKTISATRILDPFKRIDGDLLDTQADYIAHQCNTKTKAGKGLSKQIFDKFPDADDYSRKTHAPLGTCKYHGRIINMFAQRNPGKPSSAGDSAEARELWFQMCLNHISKHIPETASIAFPYGIGCGLAKGNWESYEKMLRDFAINRKGEVYLFKKS